MQSLGQVDQGELERKRIKTLEHQVTLKLSYLIMPINFSRLLLKNFLSFYGLIVLQLSGYFTQNKAGVILEGLVHYTLSFS